MVKEARRHNWWFTDIALPNYALYCCLHGKATGMQTEVTKLLTRHQGQENLFQEVCKEETDWDFLIKSFFRQTGVNNFRKNVEVLKQKIFELNPQQKLLQAEEKLKKKQEGLAIFSEKKTQAMDRDFVLVNDTNYKRLVREIKEIQEEILEIAAVKAKVGEVLEWIWVVE